MKKKTNNNINPKVSKQDIAKWKKKLTVKSKTTLKVLLISGISLIAIGGGVGGYFAYNNIKLQQEAKNKCTITFDTNGGSTINKVIVNKGQKVEKPDDPIKTGFSLSSWCYDSELKSSVSFPFTVNDNMTLYAKWDVTKFTVEYYKNPSDLEPYDSQTIAYNKSVDTPPNAPTKEGYKFAGWYTTDEETHETTIRRFYYNEPITSNLAVYAKWVKEDENCIVTFDYGKDPDHEEKYNVYEYDVKKGETIAEPEKPEYSGFTFSNWRTNIADPDSTYDFSEPVNDDITLSAKWNKEGYCSVTYVYGDKKSFKTVPVLKGSEFAKPVDPSFPGYIFQKWYLDKEFTKEAKFPISIEKDETPLYADWVEASWFVTEDEYKDSFRNLVDIEGTEHKTQQYIADGYCSKSTKEKDKEEVYDFIVSYLQVNDEYEKCGINDASYPFLYTKKQNNYSIYTKADPSNNGIYDSIKNVNIRGQLATVFSKLYDCYKDFKINKDLKAFTYELKDSEYSIETKLYFENQKINKIDCNYTHTVNDVSTIYNIKFQYGYFDPTITFPSNIELTQEIDKHIHTFNDNMITSTKIEANNIGDHIINTQENKTPNNLRIIKCFKPDESDLVPVDFVTEDIVIYRNDEVLSSDKYEFKTVDGIKVLSLNDPTVVEPKPENLNILLHISTAVEYDVYLKFLAE